MNVAGNGMASFHIYDRHGLEELVNMGTQLVLHIRLAL